MFLADPFKADTSRQSTIEVIFQLANFQQKIYGCLSKGLFLYPTALLIDQETLDYWGWDELQSHIVYLTKPQPISLPCNTVGNEGWFTLLAALVGACQPHLGRSFLTTIYHQLTAAGYLVKKQKEDDILY